MSQNQEQIKKALEAGDALFFEQKFEGAAPHYKEAMRIHRGEKSCESNLCFRAQVRYGASLVFKKERGKAVFEEAARLFEQALGFKSEDAAARRRDEAEAYRYWGDALVELELCAEDRPRNFSDAFAKYQQATRLWPSYPEAYKAWGNALYFSDNAEQAMKKYKEATHHKRDYPEAFFNWGVLLQSRGDLDRAVEKYERVIEIGKEHVGAAYNNWGRILEAQGELQSATEKFGEAARLAPGSEDDYIIYNNYGWALGNVGRFGEAVEMLKRSQQCRPDYYYAYHNEAFVYWQEGRYRDARRVAAEADRHYRAALERKRREKDGDFFRSYGELLHKVLLDRLARDDRAGAPESAESAYSAALEFRRDDVDAAVGLVSLYAELREEMPSLDKKAAAYWRAADLTVSARRSLEDRLKKKEKEKAGGAGRESGNGADLAADRRTASDLFKLGRLLLAAKEYEAAEGYLLKAVAADPTRAEPYADLGVIYVRREDYKPAARYFESSLERDPVNLSVRSNLAETYRHLGRVDDAEREYKRILGVTECHVESYIGLGEVYIEMGDGNADMFEEAISNFDKALSVSNLICASRRLRKKERAAVYYAKGYARFKLYKSVKLSADEGLLRDACDDFALAYECDPTLHKAKRARERVQSQLRRSAGHRVAKVLGPVLIFTTAFALFVLTQGSFFFGWPQLDPAHPIDATNYTAASFGALMFMVASLTLPQLLKFKVAGVELEKSSIEQVSLPENFQLSKPEVSAGAS